MGNLEKIAIQEAKNEAAIHLKMFVTLFLIAVAVSMAVNVWLSLVPLLISLACLKDYAYKRHVSKVLLMEIERDQNDDDLEDASTDTKSVVVDLGDEAPPIRITCDATAAGCMALLSEIREKIESDKVAFIAEFNTLREACAQADPIWADSIRGLEIEELNVPPPEGSLFSTKKHVYANVVFAGQAKHYWLARYGLGGFSDFGNLR
jgi:hypothetical protein